MDGFIVVGNMNACTYKEVFPLIKANKVRLGYNTVKTFNTEEGDKKFSNTSWFVTYPVQKKPLTLTKTYNPTDYPKYYNYDAIEVSKVTDIPKDYDGVIGVPITFLDKYNPNQFEIIGLAADKRDEGEIFVKGKQTYLDERHKKFVGMVLNGKATYARILIRKIKELPTEEEDILNKNEM